MILDETLSWPFFDDGHRRYRSAGEGKAQVGSLL